MNLLEQDRLAISILQDDIRCGRYLFAKTKLIHTRSCRAASAVDHHIGIINLRHAIAQRTTLIAILEYELACAVDGTTWYRFVFANSLSEIIERKKDRNIEIFSSDRYGQHIEVFSGKIEDYSPSAIWYLLCERNFNERIISISEDSSPDVITLFIEKSTESLKIRYYSPDVGKCQILAVPASFDKNSKKDTIFESFLDSLQI